VFQGIPRLRNLPVWSALTDRRQATSVVLSLALLSCGGDRPSSPSDSGSLNLPRVPRQATASCADDSVTYLVDFSRYVADPTASTLEARMTVGERAGLGLVGTGCDWSVGDSQWSSSNTSVASVAAQRVSFTASVSADSPGESLVSVQFKAHDGRQYRTTLAYCSVRVDGSGYCPTPRKIDILRVVPR
jgi:hypothetical protein